MPAIVSLQSMFSVRRSVPGARVFARVLKALHESRSREAAQLIWRHRELIQNFEDADCYCRADRSKPENDAP
jgi:hypothetical protein